MVTLEGGSCRSNGSDVRHVILGVLELIHEAVGSDGSRGRSVGGGERSEGSVGEVLRRLRRERRRERLGRRRDDDGRSTLLDVVELLGDLVEEPLDVEVLDLRDGER